MPQSQVLHLFTLSPYSTLADATVSRRYANVNYDGSGAPGPFISRVVLNGLPNYRRDMFRDGGLGGSSSIAVGELVLANADGYLEELVEVDGDLNLDGWQFEWRTALHTGGAHSDFPSWANTNV